MTVGGGGENREDIKSKKIGVPFLAFVFDSCTVRRKSGEKRRKKKRRGSQVRESEERGDEATLSILASFAFESIKLEGRPRAKNTDSLGNSREEEGS